MKAFSMREPIEFGWRTFQERPWFFVGMTAGTLFLFWMLSSIADGQKGDDAGAFIVGLATTILALVIEIVLMNWALKAHDDVREVTVAYGWSRIPFWPYLGVKLASAGIVILGLILLVVPGIIAALALMFSSYLVLDKGMMPLAALKESARLTKGHRLQLLGLMALIVLMNIAGMLVFFVGVFVTAPVSMLAMVHAYRMLETAAPHHG